MTHAQLGRLFDYDNVLGAHIIRTSDGRNVAALDVRNPAYTDYSERDRIAAELVRRWNAFEDGGVVALIVEALREFIDFAPRVRSESRSIANSWPLMISQSDFYRSVIDQADAALAALTEEAGDMTACPDCGCPEDDHRFWAAYQRLVAEDNGARRDGPNPCLNCLNCGRSGE